MFFRLRVAGSIYLFICWFICWFVYWGRIHLFIYWLTCLFLDFLIDLFDYLSIYWCNCLFVDLFSCWSIYLFIDWFTYLLMDLFVHLSIYYLLTYLFIYIYWHIYPQETKCKASIWSEISCSPLPSLNWLFHAWLIIFSPDQPMLKITRRKSQIPNYPPGN